MLYWTNESLRGWTDPDLLQSRKSRGSLGQRNGRSEEETRLPSVDRDEDPSFLVRCLRTRFRAQGSTWLPLQPNGPQAFSVRLCDAEVHFETASHWETLDNSRAPVGQSYEALYRRPTNVRERNGLTANAIALNWNGKSRVGFARHSPLRREGERSPASIDGPVGLLPRLAKSKYYHRALVPPTSDHAFAGDVSDRFSELACGTDRAMLLRRPTRCRTTDTEAPNPGFLTMTTRSARRARAPFCSSA